MGKGYYTRSRREACGRGALAVVADSGASWNNFSIVDETVVRPLEHFGFPYRVVDLARERLDRKTLEGCAALLLAQDRIGSRISGAEAKLISAAVKEAGTGLVVLDPDLRAFPDGLLEIFGFSGINDAPYATDTLVINDNTHYITGMQAEHEFHKFNRMTSAVMAEEWGGWTTPLVQAVLGKEQLVYSRHLAPGTAFMPGNYPVLFSARFGAGRAVQFTLSPRVWRPWFMGRCRGIDDLFWRSIVWAALKPFAANMIPPFAAVSFDDCRGRHDFAYADMINSYGYLPLVSLFINEVPERLYPKISEGLKNKTIQYNAHALDYYNLMLFDFGRGEYPVEKLSEIFSYEDSFWKKVGSLPGPAVRKHWGEYGVNSLPFLKERGRMYFNPLHGFGLLKSDYCRTDGYWPYNLPHCYYDYLPDDHDFFGFAAHPDRGTEDFLSGATVLHGESPVNDVEKAAAQAAAQLRHGLRAGFFGEMITHEQKLTVLSLDQWGRILKRLGEITSGMEKIPTGYDQVGPYIKGKDGAAITFSSPKGGGIEVGLEGETGSEIKISVFTEDEGTVNRAYIPAGPFKGAGKISA